MSSKITKTTQHARECHNELINIYQDKIYEVAEPRYTHINGSKQEVLLRRKFFPVESLRKIFTIDDVKAILSHNCENCQKHIADNPPAHPDQYSPERILKTDAILNLFALLVVLRYPLLIGTFLVSYEDDFIPLPRYFNLYELRDKYFCQLPDKAKDKLGAEFQEQKWQFSVPKFDNGTFQSYEEGTILPFLNEEPIDKGGYGNVFKVWVHPYYCGLGPKQATGGLQRNGRIFARKEIITQDVIEFVKEKTTLERIRSLKDDHLVQIQKTYQLGTKFNILFPCAKTNLHKYLRHSRWHAPQNPRISKNPLWEQVLGITKALSKIINFTDPDDPEHVIFGYHLDLKPQNILIDNTAVGSGDIFKITDFGQTRFVNPAFATSNRIIGAGGTDAYAPPEYFEGHIDRAYDIWSLGIVVLEILAFAIKGVDGLTDRNTGLDTVRGTTEGGQTNSRFFTGQGPQAKVKPAILDWIKALMLDPIIQNKESQMFVQNLISLIIEMLEPQRKKRKSIDDVVIRMGEIFNMKVSGTTEVTADSLRVKDEVILVDLKKVDYYPRGIDGRQSMRLPLIILENNNHRLRTWVGSPIMPASDQRQEMALVLAFQHTAEVENGFPLSFSAIKDGYAVSLQDQYIIVADKIVARRLQMALTSHVVSDRYRISTVSVTEYRYPLDNVISKFKSFTSRASKAAKSDEEDSRRKTFVPFWMELWIEKPHTSADLVQPAATPAAGRRANRQVEPGKLVPQGRVVIYCADRTIILPFVRECQLAKQQDMKQLRSHHVTFEPMDKTQSEFFRASYILPSKGTIPAIPMYHPALREAETSGEFRCESLVLRFEYPEEAYMFYKLYKNEKARWLDEIKGKPAPIKSSMPPP